MSPKIYTDVPKLLRDNAACEARRAQLAEPHVAPLCSFVARLRMRTGKDIPDFDPWDGGIDARIMFLLEAPGPRAVGSGFISRNNPDETAKNFFEFNREAGIDRRQTVTWNVVPWYIGDGGRIRAATAADVRAGTESLAELMALLRNLCAVVLVGKKAQRVSASVEELLPRARVFKALHPSPRVVNTDPQNRSRILEKLRDVAAYVANQL